MTNSATGVTFFPPSTFILVELRQTCRQRPQGQSLSPGQHTLAGDTRGGRSTIQSLRMAPSQTIEEDAFGPGRPTGLPHTSHLVQRWCGHQELIYVWRPWAYVDNVAAQVACNSCRRMGVHGPLDTSERGSGRSAADSESGATSHVSDAPVEGGDLRR